MKDILRNTTDKLRATTAAGVLSLVALNSCASDSSANEERVIPECAVHVDRDTDATFIESVAEKSGVDTEVLISQTEQLNSGIDINHLSKGDDIALGAQACRGLLEDRDAIYEFGLRFIADNAPTN